MARTVALYFDHVVGSTRVFASTKFVEQVVRKFQFVFLEFFFQFLEIERVTPALEVVRLVLSFKSFNFLGYVCIIEFLIGEVGREPVV